MASTNAAGIPSLHNDFDSELESALQAAIQNLRMAIEAVRKERETRKTVDRLLAEISHDIRQGNVRIV